MSNNETRYGTRPDAAIGRLNEVFSKTQEPSREEIFAAIKSLVFTPADDRLKSAIYEVNRSNILEAIRQGANVNSQDIYGLTPLMHAMHIQWEILPDSKSAIHIGNIELLLKHGADINITEDEEGLAALHLICMQYNKYSAAIQATAVEILIKAGADPLTRSTKGETAIDIAKNRGEQDLCALLEKHVLQKTQKINKNESNSSLGL